MDLEDIKAEYRIFVNQVYDSYGYLEEITHETDKFLSEYNMTKNYNEKFANEIENNLLYLEKFLQDIDNIIEDIDKLNFLEIELPKADLANIVQYKQYPTNKNEDILVPKGFRFNFE